MAWLTKDRYMRKVSAKGVAGKAEVSARRRQLRWLLGGMQPVAWLIESRRPHAADLGPAIRCERLTLHSADGVLARAFLTGPATAWSQVPAVIYCHAHGNRYQIGASELIEGRPALADPPYARALADAGIVAICLDLPCFGERAAEAESAAAKRHLWHGATLFGQMLAELLGLLAVLRQIGGIDMNRVGAMGISMGATLAFWLGALEPRLKAVAHLCCFADLATLVREGSHDLHGIYMTVPGLLNHVRTGEIAGMVAPRPQLVCIGEDDPLTPPTAVDLAVSDARRAYQEFNAAEAFHIIRENGTGHRETALMRQEAISFLKASL